LLAGLRDTFPGRPDLTLAAYNGGEAATRRWLAAYEDAGIDVFTEKITFEETRTYVRKVLASEAAYAYLYVPEAFDDLLAK